MSDDWIEHHPRTEQLRQIVEAFESIGSALENAAKKAELQLTASAVERSAGGISMHVIERNRAEADQIEAEAMETLLKGLKMFRRDFAYWERLAAQHAMHELGFTQRRAASLLGASTNTTNRWAQHPLDPDEVPTYDN